MQERQNKCAIHSHFFSFRFLGNFWANQFQKSAHQQHNAGMGDHHHGGSCAHEHNEEPELERGAEYSLYQ